MLRRYLMALQFLTRIPIPWAFEYSPERMAQAAAFFPLVGATVGAILALVNYVGGLVWSTPVVVALILIAEILVTGGLHLDGLADSADGIFSGRSRERILEIMRDSRIGTYGVLALVANFAIKAAVLATLPESMRGWLLVVVPALARTGFLSVMMYFPYARSGAGLGRSFADCVGLKELLLGLILGGSVAVLSVGPVLGSLGLVTAVIAALVAGAWLAKRLGGMTGDTYGAIEEWIALVLLLVAAAVWRGL